jgi:hypothetical protein
MRNINKKAIQQLADRIEKENELFEAMTNDEKKVVIAQDCLVRIQAQQLVAYCGMFLNNPMEFKSIDQPIQSQLNTPEVEIQCEVCAKGSLFMSLIGRVNKFTYYDLQSGNSIEDAQHKKLLEIFTERELAYIELAFEGDQFIKRTIPDEKGEFDDIYFTEENILKAREFYAKYGGQYWGSLDDYDAFDVAANDQEDFAEENQERLIAICENIIQNKGRFIL